MNRIEARPERAKAVEKPTEEMTMKSDIIKTFKEDCVGMGNKAQVVKEDGVFYTELFDSEGCLVYCTSYEKATPALQECREWVA